MDVFRPKINQFSKNFKILLEIDKTHKIHISGPKISLFRAFLVILQPILGPLFLCIKGKSHFQTYLAALKPPHNRTTEIVFNSIKRFLPLGPPPYCLKSTCQVKKWHFPLQSYKGEIQLLGHTFLHKNGHRIL